MESDLCVAPAYYKRVRRSSVYHQIARLDSGCIHGIRQVDNEVNWPSTDNAVAGWVTRGNRKTQRHKVDEDVLLRAAAGDHPPIGPAADGRVPEGAVVVVVALVG